MKLKLALIAFILFMRPVSGFAALPLSDAEKKQKIEAMIALFEPFFKVPQIDAAEAIKLAREGSTLILDVREDKEMKVSRIANAINAKQFEQNPEQYKNRKIIAYCTIGYRSAAYIQKWNKRGFNMQNLRGSLLLWTHAQGTLVDSSGQATQDVHVYGRDWDLLPAAYKARY